MEFASEMVVKASLQKQKISEVPTTLSPDGRDRPPHLRSFRDGWRHLRFLLLMCPLWLYFIPAALLIFGGLGVMTWLTPGPQLVGGVQFDIHSMLLGSLALILGYQTLWLWAYAKIYGWTSGLLPARTFSSRIFDYLNLERRLVRGRRDGLGRRRPHSLPISRSGGVKSHGPLEVQHTFRYALWGFTLVVLGVQTIYGSFFLSMLGMTERARELRENSSKRLRTLSHPVLRTGAKRSCINAALASVPAQRRQSCGHGPDRGQLLRRVCRSRLGLANPDRRTHRRAWHDAVDGSIFLHDRRSTASRLRMAL